MEFMNTKGLLKQQLMNHLALLQRALERMTRKRSIYDGLCLQHDKVGQHITQYFDIWQTFVAVPGQLELPPDVGAMINSLEMQKIRLDNVKAVIDNFTQNHAWHVDKVTRTLEVVNQARTLTEVSSICIPNVDWLQTVSYPNVEQIEAEWNRGGMLSRIEFYIDHFQNLIRENTEDDRGDNGESPRKKRRFN